VAFAILSAMLVKLTQTLLVLTPLQSLSNGADPLNTGAETRLGKYNYKYGVWGPHPLFFYRNTVLSTGVASGANQLKLNRKFWLLKPTRQPPTCHQGTGVG